MIQVSNVYWNEAYVKKSNAVYAFFEKGSCYARKNEL